MLAVLRLRAACSGRCLPQVHAFDACPHCKPSVSACSQTKNRGAVLCGKLDCSVLFSSFVVGCFNLTVCLAKRMDGIFDLTADCAAIFVLRPIAPSQNQFFIPSLMIVACNSNAVFFTLFVTSVVFVQHNATHMTNNILPTTLVYDLYFLIFSHAMILSFLLTITCNRVFHIVVTTLKGLCGHTVCALRFLHLYFLATRLLSLDIIVTKHSKIHTHFSASQHCLSASFV